MDSFEVPKNDGGIEGNSRLGQLVLHWLREDLEERGPRKGQSAEGKTYPNLEGKGGYGLEQSLK
jgi:CCR4-NOT complex subunit CAF16